MLKVKTSKMERQNVETYVFLLPPVSLPFFRRIVDLFDRLTVFMSVSQKLKVYKSKYTETKNYWKCVIWGMIYCCVNTYMKVTKIIIYFYPLMLIHFAVQKFKGPNDVYHFRSLKYEKYTNETKQNKKITHLMHLLHTNYCIHWSDFRSRISVNFNLMLFHLCHLNLLVFQFMHLFTVAFKYIWVVVLSIF